MDKEIILGGPDLTNENAQNGDWTGLLKWGTLPPTGFEDVRYHEL